jgi:hypothetical protein
MMLLGDGWLASSPDINTILSIATIDARLADQADYRAAAEAMRANGVVLQTRFIHPADELIGRLVLINPRPRVEDRQATLDAMREVFVPIHPYNLLVLAQTGTETEERAIAGMVYAHQSSADTAIPILFQRLSSYQNFLTRQTWKQIMERAGVATTDASVYPASTDRFVTNITFHSPLPSSEVPSTGIAEVPGRAFGELAGGYQSWVLNWVTPAQEVPSYN